MTSIRLGDQFLPSLIFADFVGVSENPQKTEIHEITTWIITLGGFIFADKGINGTLLRNNLAGSWEIMGITIWHHDNSVFLTT